MDLTVKQITLTCLDGKDRNITFSESGRIRYYNMKNGENYGSSYSLNTKDFPLWTPETNPNFTFQYKKTLPKWITKEMLEKITPTKAIPFIVEQWTESEIEDVQQTQTEKDDKK